jgi:hypothetical protein
MSLALRARKREVISSMSVGRMEESNTVVLASGTRAPAVASRRSCRGASVLGFLGGEKAAQDVSLGNSSEGRSSAVAFAGPSRPDWNSVSGVREVAMVGFVKKPGHRGWIDGRRDLGLNPNQARIDGGGSERKRERKGAVGGESAKANRTLGTGWTRGWKQCKALVFDVVDEIRQREGR